MELKPIQENVTEVTFNNGTVVLFSYRTPVAALIPGDGWYRTSTRWSNTTSRHINKWLGGIEAKSVEQAVLDNLVGGM